MKQEQIQPPAQQGAGWGNTPLGMTLKVMGNMLIDMMLVAASFYLAAWLKWEWMIPSQIHIYLDVHIWAFMGIHLIVFVCFGLYRRIWLYAGVNDLLQLAEATMLAMFLCFLYSMMQPTRLFLSMTVLAWLLSFLMISSIRLAPRLIRYLRSGRLRKSARGRIRTLIVGAGDAGAALVLEFSRSLNDHMVVGFVDDNPAKQGMRLHNIPVLGGSDAISTLVEQYSIQEIVIAIPSAAQNELNRILDECRKTNCKTRIMPYIHKFQKPDGLLPMIRDVNISDLLGRDEVVLDTEAISGYLHDKVVLVTGGGGSIGSELCRQIVNFQPRLLLVLDIYENNAYDLQMELGMDYGLKEDKVKVLIGSVRDREMLRRLFERYRPEVVLHAAAHKHVPLMEGSPLEALKNNVFGTYNVASMAAEFKVRRFVLISTDKAVNPTNVMGASKRLAEMVVQGMRHGSQTEFVAVRFGNVLGSNGSVLPLFKRQIEHGGPVTVTHPDITRFFMTIPEAARLVLQAGAMAKGGEIFILDMGQPVRIADMARDMIRLSGFEPDRDIKIKYVGLRPGEKLYEELMLAEEGTCSTSSKKIFTAKPQDVTREQLESILQKLRQCIDENGDVRACLEEVVPTYHHECEKPAASTPHQQ